MAAVLVRGIVAGFGIIHYGVDSALWLLVFGATALVGLVLLAWGGRTLFSVLPVPRISVSVER